MKVLLHDKVYDLLKWLCLIVLPGLSVCYAALAEIWGWPYAAEVAKTVTAICTLIGALIGVSTAALHKEQADEKDNDEANR